MTKEQKEKFITEETEKIRGPSVRYERMIDWQMYASIARSAKTTRDKKRVRDPTKMIARLEEESTELRAKPATK